MTASLLWICSREVGGSLSRFVFDFHQQIAFDAEPVTQPRAAARGKLNDVCRLGSEIAQRDHARHDI